MTDPAWEQALQEALERHEAEWACTCSRTEVRYKTNRAGATTYYSQCVDCGQYSALKGASLPPAAKQGAEPVDMALRESFWRARSMARDVAVRNARVRNDSAFWRWYDGYLSSAEWRERRRLVLDRAGGQCEGCGLTKATQVHHLTYERVGNEMLFDLVSVCESCHNAIHRKDP